MNGWASTAVFLAAAFGSAGTASALGIDVTYNFVGTCTDCQGTVTATLVLGNLGEYVPGSPITITNFVSFTYGGSNLYPSFTINDLSPGLEVSGSIPAALPGPADVGIQSDGLVFNSSTDGYWDAGPAADEGTAGTWSLSTPSSAPEPGSLALLLGGLGMLAGLAGLRGRPRAND
jgi:hypothetical protein